jgi:hypothetical protein
MGAVMPKVKFTMPVSLKAVVDLHQSQQYQQLVYQFGVKHRGYLSNFILHH